MLIAPQPTVLRRVGVVGAGQLARMMGEAAGESDVSVCVLATSLEECAVATCDAVVLGEPDDPVALGHLATLVDVITFDHELVDLELLRSLEEGGVVFRPNSEALHYAVDKGFQREGFWNAAIPVPRFLVVKAVSDERLLPFLDELGAPPVVKAARGGYDGRGVVFPESRDETMVTIQQMSGAGDVVVEERLTLLSEVAQLVARSSDGSLAFYPVVASEQRDAMCVEVRFPSALNDQLQRQAHELSERVATLVKPVGILAIEYFVTKRGLVVNEVALRPHNTGHWTIEGTTTSQFAQHLRAVSGQELGTIDTLSSHVVMVNVIGADQPGSLARARQVEDVFVHDYGKSWRPGRKLGHVTALGDEPTGPHVRAWRSARAYGTLTREA